ncbi:MAG: xanthine dehydrogenase family protein molybdopterin-binding subunit [Solirubrobacterales bacterium]
MSTPQTADPTATADRIGRSERRKDAGEKIRGRAEFAGDINVPRMLHGKVLRAELAHARIAAIDTSAVEAMPGVVAVLLGPELEHFDPYWGHSIKDRPILAIDRVRFQGEPVAAVAAEDEATAEAAVREIVVEYEELPVAGTIEAAIADEAPLVHDGEARPGLFHGLGKLPEREGNVCYRYRLDSGSVELAEAEAELTVEGEYEFPAVYQYAMETHTVVADFGDGEITLWASCQHPFLVRAEIADLFNLPIGRVRVIVPYLGGGFGSKSYTKMEPITAALSWKAGRPVRIQNGVDESMVTTRRHGMRCRMRTTASRDGKLLSRSVRFWLDTGAYADNGPRVCATAGDAAPGPYRWEAAHVDASCVYSNTSPAGSYRAFGSVHLQWIGESQVDELARQAGIDPLEIRRRNLLHPGEPVRPDGSGKPLDADLIGDVEKAAAAVGWGEPKREWTGRGVSVGLLTAGAHPVSRANVRIESDGSVEVNVGTTEMGQGARTVMAQIAAQELAIELERVTVQGADTRFTPYDRSTGASRSTTLAGLAVQRAAADLRERLLATAAGAWGVESVELAVADGVVRGPTQEADYAELIAERFGFSGGELVGEGEVRPEQGSGSYAEGPVFWEVCVGAAEVGVDPETGRVGVERMATIADVGKAINPLLVERQDEGAVLQGVGNALFEEMIFEDGVLTNDNLLEYRVPRIDDTPARMGAIIVENADGPGPYGAKGCGEGAQAATPAAIATALADAGVPMNELPFTPERVWRRIQQIKEAKDR